MNTILPTTLCRITPRAASSDVRSGIAWLNLVRVGISLLCLGYPYIPQRQHRRLDSPYIVSILLRPISTRVSLGRGGRSSEGEEL